MKAKTGDYTILIFDICSSTVYIEDLIKTGQVEMYWKLIESFKRKLGSMKAPGMSIYKFLGDGFIILFEPGVSVDDVIRCCRDIAQFGRNAIEEFEKTYIESAEVPRTGITMGIDTGALSRKELGGGEEYIGRAINVAARLQGSLKEKEHVYRILMSKKTYGSISDLDLRHRCVERTRTFRNLSGDTRIRCYELDSLGDWS